MSVEINPHMMNHENTQTKKHRLTTLFVKNKKAYFQSLKHRQKRDWKIFAFLVWQSQMQERFKIHMKELILDINRELYEYEQEKNWLWHTRQVLQMKTSLIAEKMKVTKAAYYQFEKAEEDGTITIQSLEKAAQALNCELIYFLKPKGDSPTLSEKLWNEVYLDAIQHPWVRSRPEKNKYLALISIVKKLIKDPQYRKKKNWNYRQSL